jgi:hypothetical protein
MLAFFIFSFTTPLDFSAVCAWISDPGISIKKAMIYDKNTFIFSSS